MLVLPCAVYGCGSRCATGITSHSLNIAVAVACTLQAIAILPHVASLLPCAALGMCSAEGGGLRSVCAA
jgi:hypothetical protein